MQIETPAHTISFLYQNYQDTPSKIWDLYESIALPDTISSPPPKIVEQNILDYVDCKKGAIFFS